jgi:hypothetical protein
MNTESGTWEHFLGMLPVSYMKMHDDSDLLLLHLQLKETYTCLRAPYGKVRSCHDIRADQNGLCV